MNECLTTPQHGKREGIGYQNKVNPQHKWMNEWMFNDTPARKQIGYWVSEKVNPQHEWERER